MIDADRLTACMPRVQNAAEWAKALDIAAQAWQINTPIRMAMFIAQIGHESEDLARLEENLNYSAKRLAEVWPKRFAARNGAGGAINGKPNTIALEIEGKPERIANITYANRNGNGSEETGDGWKYRGRGPMQTTGRANYKRTGDAIHADLITSPDLLILPQVGAMAAAYFFNASGCLRPADRGEVEAVTRIINGAALGLPNRTRRYVRALEVFGGKL
jgi:putative chitinase